MGAPVVHWEITRRATCPAGLKRVLGSLLAALLIVLLLPLYILIYVAIKFDSRGPVIFVQERWGMHTRRFKMYKFRTLRHNAPDPTPKYEMLENDARVTRVGAVLRRTSLDELPQLFNVVIGNMSLVGPRPLVEWESKECLRNHAERFLVKPGITGLSQVYARNAVDLSARLTGRGVRPAVEPPP